jgi:hypothetical protein
MRILAIAAILAFLCSCGSKPAALEDLGNRDITVPAGQVIRVDTHLTDASLPDMATCKVKSWLLHISANWN